MTNATCDLNEAQLRTIFTKNIQSDINQLRARQRSSPIAVDGVFSDDSLRSMVGLTYNGVQIQNQSQARSTYHLILQGLMRDHNVNCRLQAFGIENEFIGSGVAQRRGATVPSPTQNR